MVLETERLWLVPLTAGQLKLWFEDIQALEDELDCKYRAEPIEGFFLNIIRNQYTITKENEADYLYHTFWFLIRKADRVAVGSADFKNVPDNNGDVEIGYGLGKEFERNGYMTEAVEAMCGWAKRQETVKHVIAETEIDGFASQRVLERCGFKKYKHDTTIWWRL